MANSMPQEKRGKLKIFMGYAAGVGKTYAMLEEAQARKAEGVDIAIGYFEPHGRKETIAKTEGLEVIPRKKVEYRGSMFEEIEAPSELRGSVSLEPLSVSKVTLPCV